MWIISVKVYNEIDLSTELSKNRVKPHVFIWQQKGMQWRPSRDKALSNINRKNTTG